MAQAVMMPTTTVSGKTWTVSEMKRWSYPARFEIVEGLLYMPAPPRWPHPGIADNLHDILRGWVHRHRLGRVLSAQTGIYLNEINYLDPDVMFVRPSHIPPIGERFRTAALVVEVLSPSNIRPSRESREGNLRQVAVEEVWYVDPETRTLECRRLTPDGYVTTALFCTGDSVETPMLPGLRFPLDALWEGVDEEDPELPA